MSPHRNLLLLRIEGALTNSSSATPLLPAFYLSLGLTQTHLGIGEAIFAFCWLLFDIPTGWLADRFSRKVCNLLGDIVATGSFVVMACATSFGGIIAASILLALGHTASQGADIALVRDYCQKLNRSFAHELSLMHILSPVSLVGFIGIGSLVAMYDLRLAILCGGLPFLIGAVIACLVEDTGERRIVNTSNRTLLHQIRIALIDVKSIIRYCLYDNRRLGWLILTRAIMINLTGSIGWIITPLLLRIGMPTFVAGIGWILYIIAIGIGSWLYRHTINRWSKAIQIFLPSCIALGAMAVLGWTTTIWTISLFGFVGLCRGWHSTMFAPLIQDEAGEDIQATVSSVSVSLVLGGYVIVVPFINWAGSVSEKWAFIANCALFLPLVVLAAKLMPRGSAR